MTEKQRLQFEQRDQRRRTLLKGLDSRIMTPDELQRAYNAMTPHQHDAMKTHLLKLASFGGRRPFKQTLPDYCFTVYTTDHEVTVQ